MPEGTDVLINATSIGLFEPDARVPIDVETLKPPLVVADVIFNPPETRLLRDAKAARLHAAGRSWACSSIRQ